MLAMSYGLVIKFSPCKIVLATEDVMFFNVMVALIPFQMVLTLFQFDSKYFYNNFVYFFPKELISFHKG